MALPGPGNVTRPLSKGYTARLDNLFLRLLPSAEAPNVIRTAPLQAPTINTNENPEDFTKEEFGTVFSRTDFDGGEGLAFAHKRDNPDEAFSQYWDSVGVTPVDSKSGETSALKLLRDVDLVEVTSSATPVMVNYRGEFFYSVGPEIRNRTQLTTENPNILEGNQNVNSLVVLGEKLYAGLGSNGIHVRNATTSPSAWTHFSAGPVDKVWSIKGRLIFARGNQLYETTDGTTQTLLHSLPNTAKWVSVAEGGPVIFAVSNDRTIYSFSLDENATSPVLKLVSRTSVNNETPTMVAAVSSLIFVGTEEKNETSTGAIGRLYVGNLANDLTITNLQLKREWGTDTSTVNSAPFAPYISRDNLYFGISEPTRTHLWRYNFTHGALFRHIGNNTIGKIHSITSVDGALKYSIENYAVLQESNRYVTSGYLISPVADFYTTEKKAWAGATLNVEPLSKDEKVELFYTTKIANIKDSTATDWIKIKSVTDGTDDRATMLQGVNSTHLAAMVVISTTDTLNTPKVQAFSFKAYPGPGDIIIELMVNISDRIKIPGKRYFKARGLGDRLYQELKGREGTSVELDLLRPKDLIRGTVESVTIPVLASSTRGSHTQYARVVVRGRRAEPASITSSVGALGIGRLGIIKLGGPE